MNRLLDKEIRTLFRDAGITSYSLCHAKLIAKAQNTKTHQADVAFLKHNHPEFTYKDGVGFVVINIQQGDWQEFIKGE